MHTCIHIRTYMRACIHACMHACMHADMHTYITTYLLTYTPTYMIGYTCIHMPACSRSELLNTSIHFGWKLSGRQKPTQTTIVLGQPTSNHVKL